METPKGVNDLRLRSDGESRKEYECGCYHRRHEHKVLWSFFAVCPMHKSAVRAEWNARPWSQKLFSYAMLIWLLVLTAVGLGIVIFVLWKITGVFF